MKHVVRILLAGLIVFSACSSEDNDPGSGESCENAKKEQKKAWDAYAAKVNQHPGANAAPSVLEKHNAEAKVLHDFAEQKSAEMHAACD